MHSLQSESPESERRLTSFARALDSESLVGQNMSLSVMN